MQVINIVNLLLPIAAVFATAATAADFDQSWARIRRQTAEQKKSTSAAPLKKTDEKFDPNNPQKNPAPKDGKVEVPLLRGPAPDYDEGPANAPQNGPPALPQLGSQQNRQSPFPQFNSRGGASGGSGTDLRNRNQPPNQRGSSNYPGGDFSKGGEGANYGQECVDFKGSPGVCTPLSKCHSNFKSTPLWEKMRHKVPLLTCPLENYEEYVGVCCPIYLAKPYQPRPGYEGDGGPIKPQPGTDYLPVTPGVGGDTRRPYHPYDLETIKRTNLEAGLGVKPGSSPAAGAHAYSRGNAETYALSDIAVRNLYG